jgi:arginine metabolism regulation protein II
MSGDISSCGLHLQAAAKLIMETAKSKTHYSTRSAALHRIYFYLSTIYDSTAMPVPGSSAKAQETSNVESPLSDDCAAIDGLEITISPRAGFYNTKHKGGYESIYAIPKDLLVFLAQTTELINLTSEARERSGTTHIPFTLVQRCDELEMRIMDWQTDPIPADATSSPIANPSIIYNMTHAFHKAIIIFFAQNIRLMGHRYLRHYVEDVIDSIEEVERIKVECQVSASPLYWPAFIAASEAFDLRLQDRFKNWYAQVEPNAIGSMNTGISLLHHVWTEGPSTGAHLTSLWRHIAMRTGTLLMLN